MFATLASNPLISSSLVSGAGILVLSRSRPALPAALRRGLAGLAGLVGPNRYRPERHYMRGGNTEGSRSLAMARGRIAGRG
jgi:hypothetical protein